MKKLLIGTPSRGTIPIEYLNWLLRFLSSGLPGYSARIRFATGGTVNMGRNELAHVLLSENYDEILMVDTDMVPDEDRIMRIMSHDVNFVGGPYCKRRGGIPDWTFTPKPNGERRPDGLWECSAMGLGFSRVRRCVFEGVQAAFPEHEYFDKQGNRDMAEFFPMGVLGPRSAAARLAKIKRILTESTTPANEKVDRIQQAVFEDQPKGTFYGEDYFWCYMATKAGFKVWADTGMAPVGHMGKAIYPITPDKVGLHPGGETAVVEANHRM